MGRQGEELPANHVISMVVRKVNLNDILNRRSDLSTFLVHLTRRYDTDARTNLESIMRTRSISARTVYGHLSRHVNQLRNGGAAHKVVCFTETPLEFTHLLVSEIENRTYQLEPYGLAVTKRQGRERGVNPIWYVDITPGHDWMTQQLDRLRDRFLADQDGEQDIGRIFAFIEQMGNSPWQDGGYCKEFWWEREWRHVGDFALPDAIICLCPEADIGHFGTLMSELNFRGSCIDPQWSLERIIARLAGFQDEEVNILRNA